MKEMKRIIAFVLALTMVFTLFAVLPVFQVSAEDAAVEEAAPEAVPTESEEAAPETTEEAAPEAPVSGTEEATEPEAPVSGTEEATEPEEAVSETEEAVRGNAVLAAASDDNVICDGEKYYIWLKETPSTSGDYDPVKELRSMRYRWNINGAGNTFNAVVHLDLASGDNCEMLFDDVGGGYFGIRHADSGYWIDVEHDSSKVGNVLHQYHQDLKRDNQYFRFEPVDGEEDTYYIISKKPTAQETTCMLVQRTTK